jgi:2-keto-3-deoxy-galactonokinase
MTHLIGVDWGTSSFRAALMSSDGRVLSDISADAGITRVTGAYDSPKFSTPTLDRGGLRTLTLA